MLNITSSLPDFIYDAAKDPTSTRPNYNLRNGVQINSVVIHYTVSNRDTSLKIFTKGRDVSVHYMIAEDGYLYQTVKEDYKAWHAGISSWKGKEYLNQNSIGIELVNPGSGEPRCYPTIYDNQKGKSGCTKNYFPEPQISKLIDLLLDIKARHGENIPSSNIIGHSDAAPGRKIDPGAVFPWKELAKKGLGIDCNHDDNKDGANLVIGSKSSSPETIRNIQQKLSSLGYKVSVDGSYTQQTADVIRAFKFHWQQDTKTGWGDWDMAADNCLNELLGKQGAEGYIEL